MAQLVKLQDYISRYEVDVFKYPSQFIRLKKDQYYKLLNEWKLELEEEQYHASIPATELELKQKFLNRIFPFQLKWASSTLSEVSFLDKTYEKDLRLKYFLQRFPDTYLLMYEPIFKLKKAIIDGEIILITPSEILCITELEEKASTHFKPVDDRKWLKIENGKESSIVSPLIGLKRIEKTIQSILDYNNIEFSTRKIVLAKKHTIAKTYIPYQTDYVDMSYYETWFNNLRQKSLPLKFRQLKACEALLNHTQKTFVKRPEWQDDESDLIIE
ncbi:NERD domain-containing protein [Bacillaceae bacterium W0354]